MSLYSYYEAPRGQTLDGFVDPIDMPTAIRVIAPPNARSSHALAGAICRSLGAVRDPQTQATGETTLLSSAAAWALATRVSDVYVAAAEDLTRPAVLDMIDFAGRIGAHLHLVFSYGQVYTHADTINEIGFRSRSFTDLPAALRDPTTTPATPLHAVPEPANITVPRDNWTSFRAAYHAALPPPDVEQLDAIYLNAYATARASTARTPDDISALTGALWQQHGITDTTRIVVTRAIQAGLFRNGLLVRLDPEPFTRHVQQRHVNLMTDHNYNELTGFIDPWRAAATILHAFHISTETSLALRALDVTPQGDIPSLNITIPPSAQTILAAQRWHQLITQDANPPLFNQATIPLRRGIRTVVNTFDLPLIPYWRTIKDDKNRGNTGIKVEAIA